MVRKVAIQDPLKPRANRRHGFVPALVKLRPDRGQRRSHALLGRQSYDLELPSSVRSTTVRKAQEVERFPSAPPPSAPSFDRKAAELDQTRLVRVRGEPELRQPFPKVLQESLRRPHILKARHTIVGTTNHNDLSLLWLFAPALDPGIEGVVEVNVRRQRRNDSLNAKGNFNFERLPRGGNRRKPGNRVSCPGFLSPVSPTSCGRLSQVDSHLTADRESLLCWWNSSILYARSDDQSENPCSY